MDTDSRDASGFVVLTEEPNLMRAHWVAGAVEAAGIPTFVDEDNLADEFAMSQRVLGLLRVRVLVPADRLAEARTVFLDLSQPIPLIDEEEDDARPPSAPRLSAASVLNVVLLLVVLGIGTVVLVRGCGPGNAARPSDAEPGTPPTPPPPPPRSTPPILHR